MCELGHIKLNELLENFQCIERLGGRRQVPRHLGNGGGGGGKHTPCDEGHIYPISRIRRCCRHRAVVEASYAAPLVAVRIRLDLQIQAQISSSSKSFRAFVEVRWEGEQAAAQLILMAPEAVTMTSDPSAGWGISSAPSAGAAATRAFAPYLPRTFWRCLEGPMRP